MHPVSQVRIVRFDRGYEVTGDNTGALVDKLVECMLAISSRFPPDNRPSAVVNLVTSPYHILSIALHVSLLEVCSEPMHVLIIRQ